MERENKKKFMNQTLPKIITLIGLLVFLGLIIGNNVPKYVNTGYTANSIQKSQEENCKEIQVPYEEQEEYMKTEYYTETVPYEKEIYLKYEAGFLNLERSCGSITDYILCWDIGLTNLDIVGGIFKVKCMFETLDDGVFEVVDSKYVKPGESEKFICEANIDLGEDIRFKSYLVEPPTRKETRYKEVQREKQVTAYRPVTKYRTETVCEDD